MIHDEYVLYVCPDPDCEYWDVEPGCCPNYNAHPLGDYEDLCEIVVAPVKVRSLRPK